MGDATPDMTDVKKRPVFSKQGILDRQKITKEEYDKKVAELRQTFEQVAATKEGEKVLRYVFILCGGDLGSVRRDKEGAISVNDTLVALGAKNLWETLRFNLTSATLKKVERHDWE
ncbi:MAG: hypothetical protein KAU50_04415 [Candidatus Marinimicrobia bacterium]|nr:hypothetical protein [Candidatus Neomarinimicrobiota bacterium]